MKWTYLPTFIITLQLAACHSATQMNNNTTKQQNHAGEIFDKQGHRGCRGLMPENTIPAMLHALKLGVTTLEMDVVITKDKEVILSHEPFFNHDISTKPGGEFVKEIEERGLNIYQMTYSEVKTFDVGIKPHPRFPRQQKIKATKPLLADVFDSVSSYMKTARRPYPFFNIETKSQPASDNTYHPEPKEFVDLLMKLVYQKNMQEQVTVQSFDFRTLRYLHQKYPAISTAILIENFDTRSLDDQLKDLGFLPAIYSPHFSLVTHELVKACHSKKLKIIPWTVNDRAEIERLKKAGVDGLISDYPDLF